jgi:uncharacterized Ntn-hydrolase superfamily protein
MKVSSQDTFSIVAVDTLTGEIGSAGASCIDNNAIPGGAIIISDIIPARGAIHTQSYWVSANQVNAHNRMVLGDSPQEIIDWLVANDVQNLPGRRQYGIVDVDAEGNPRSAAFTGADCFNWKGHKTGPNFSIQGNILLGEQIINDMEAGFLQTEGTLSDKLMAALQGAKVAGADTRCLNEGVSSLSAFIRMARPEDDPDSLYLDLNVPVTPFGVEPIDELQELYDEWKQLVAVRTIQDRVDFAVEYFSEMKVVTINPSHVDEPYRWTLYNSEGKVIHQPATAKGNISIRMNSYSAGLYIINISNSKHQSLSFKFVIH